MGDATLLCRIAEIISRKTLLVVILLASWTILSIIMYAAEILLGPYIGFIHLMSPPPLPKANTFSHGLVTQTCLQCICDLESGCKPLDCTMDQGSFSCGYFQIKECYWYDCGRPGESLEWCSRDKYCSTVCVQRYMDHYINKSGCPATCSSYARLHNGGPSGCVNNSTLQYWDKIEQRGCSEDS